MATHWKRYSRMFYYSCEWMECEKSCMRALLILELPRIKRVMINIGTGKMTRLLNDVCRAESRKRESEGAGQKEEKYFFSETQWAFTFTVPRLTSLSGEGCRLRAFQVRHGTETLYLPPLSPRWKNEQTSRWLKQIARLPKEPKIFKLAADAEGRPISREIRMPMPVKQI